MKRPQFRFKDVSDAGSRVLNALPHFILSVACLGSLVEDEHAMLDDNQIYAPQTGITQIRLQNHTNTRRIRSGVKIAVLAILSAAMASPSYAETGTVRFKFFKAGWFVGAETGAGIVELRKKIYPFHISGISAGLTFGGSSTDFVGTVRNVQRPSDIEGIYTALGAGVAVVGGMRFIQMRNAKGVILTLEGKQLGLQFDFDLSGMKVSIQRE
jgi:hypothetical protein